MSIPAQIHIRQDAAAPTVALDTAGDIAERSFQDLATPLEAALAILGRMGATFDLLHQHWQVADLDGAGQDLRVALTQAAGMAAMHDGDAATLQALAERERRVAGLASVISQPAEQMQMLSINAQLACAALGRNGDAFLTFTAQVTQAAARARRHQAELVASLEGLNRAVATARAAEPAGTVTPGQLISGIAARVRAALATVETASQRALRGMASVQARSEAISRTVVDVVRAMQVGDITRQRIEHVQHIAHLVTLPDHAAVAALGWAIATAQLRDTADELEAEATRIIRQVGGLHAAAKALTRDSRTAFGNTDHSYLAALQQEVSATGAALTALHTAFAGAEANLSAVRQAVAGLDAQVVALRHMEIDIRLLGLNTALRAGRMGEAGGPLRVIAQMLRTCGRQIADAAGAVRTDLDAILAHAKTLADTDRQAANAGVIDQVKAMTEAVARLIQTDRTIAATQSAMERECAELTLTLDRALAGFDAGERIGTLLRQVAGRAAPMAGAEAAALARQPEGQRLLDQIAASYTMARERMIQAKVTGLAAPEPAPAQTLVLDDLML